MSAEKVTIQEKVATGLAQSKLILVGEHSVVHGQPAISIPFSLVGVEATIQSASEGIYLESTFYEGPIESAPEILTGIVRTIYQTMKVLNMPNEALLIRVHSTIPPGKGLGSSASVAIAIIKSLYVYAGESYTDEQLLQLANISETYAHGAPSGIDSLTITAVNPIWYQKKQPIESITVKGEFYFVVADTGLDADTKTAVDSVTKLLKTVPKKAYHAVERLGDITHQVRDALERSSKQMLGNLLNEAQKELEVIGVSNTSLNRLIHFARQEGALGAKLTGAGHGGCMIALAKNESHATLLGEKLKQFGAHAVWPFVLKNRSE